MPECRGQRWFSVYVEFPRSNIVFGMYIMVQTCLLNEWTMQTHFYHAGTEYISVSEI